jgi:hypothetical protein
MIELHRSECCDCRAFQIPRTISDVSGQHLCAYHKDSTVLTMILFNVTVLHTTYCIWFVLAVAPVPWIAIHLPITRTLLISIR